MAEPNYTRLQHALNCAGIMKFSIDDIQKLVQYVKMEFKPGLDSKLPERGAPLFAHQAWLKIRCRAPTTNALRKLPREIRQEIFTYVLDSDGKVPSLLKALRIDEMVHADAMAVLSRQCRFEVTERNKRACIMEMQVHVWERIENLSIRIDFFPILMGKDLPSFMDSMPNLKRLELNFIDTEYTGCLFHMRASCVARTVVSNFGTLNELSIVYRSHKYMEESDNEKTKLHFNKSLGINGEYGLLKSEGGDLYRGIWTAGKGAVLTWKHHSWIEK